MAWYGVRHVVEWGEDDEDRNIYEERITLWRADSFEDEISQAETEAAEYASEILDEGEVLDLFQAYLVSKDESSGRAASIATAATNDVRDTGLLLETNLELRSSLSFATVTSRRGITLTGLSTPVPSTSALCHECECESVEHSWAEPGLAAPTAYCYSIIPAAGS